MEVGDHLVYIITNDIHNIDLFWQVGIAAMFICGFVAFKISFRQKVADEAGEHAKHWAILNAIGETLNIGDEMNFLFFEIHENKVILTAIIRSMLIVPIYCFAADMVLPAGLFLVMTGMRASLKNKLKFFVYEHFGLTPYLTDSI